jgi:hypothetical protein
MVTEALFSGLIYWLEIVTIGSSSSECSDV